MSDTHEDGTPRTPDCACLNCGHVVDAATEPFGNKPRPVAGDISVCLYCGNVAAFTADEKLRPLTDEEIVMVAGDKRILAIQRARTKVLQDRDDDE